MTGRELTAAAIQMSSTPNKDENLATAEQLIHAAASAGADLVALPELWNCHGLERAYRENSDKYLERPPASWPTSRENGASTC
jgi:predicted amidohydrolase